LERRLKIKAGNISHLTDARYFAAYGVQWLGFNFNKENPNALQLEDAKTIKNWIAGPTIVAEFDNLEADYIFKICHQLETNWIQIAGKDESLHLLSDYQVIQTFEDAHTSNSNVSDSKADILRFDMHSLDQVNDILQTNPSAIFKVNDDMLLTKNIIMNTPLTSIEIQGAHEKEVGLKSFDEINDLFDWLEHNQFVV